MTQRNEPGGIKELCCLPSFYTILEMSFILAISAIVENPTMRLNVFYFVIRM